MGIEKTDFIRGTLDMLILKVLSLEPMHGWGICQRIDQMSGSSLVVQQGSLYASLHRLTREGWIKSAWRETENGRRARYYALTRAAERQLESESVPWDRVSGGGDRVTVRRPCNIGGLWICSATVNAVCSASNRDSTSKWS